MGFANGRRVKSEHDEMNRLYVAESAMSVTGGMADHRIKIKNSDISDFAMVIAQEMSKQGIDVPGANALTANNKFDKHFIEELAADLIKNRGKSLVVAGRTQPAQVHILINAINSVLGNFGKTVSFYNIDKDLLLNADGLTDLSKNGNTDTLILIGANPIYSAPKNLRFEELLKSIEHTIQLSSHVDETSEHVEWHINQAHFLEEWNDTQSADGTIGITQQQILPLFNGISNIELLGIITNGDLVKGYDLIQNTWENILSGDFLVNDIAVEKIGTTYPLACTQDSHGMNNDKFADSAIQKRLPMLIREATLEEYKHHPEFAKHAVHHPPLVSLWEEFEYTELPQWGMTIDLNVCTGCNACSTSCQSENNIPVIGKQEVRMGREMHWIRLDRYFSGDPDDPEVVIQPVACQHCEMVPCEQVCPVVSMSEVKSVLPKADPHYTGNDKGEGE